MTTTKPILKFIALHPNAALPEASGADSIGLDLRAVRSYDIGYSFVALVNFGVVLSPESRQHTAGMQLSLRSGFANSSGCILANGVGLIEKSFAGFVDTGGDLKGLCASLHCLDKEGCWLDKGDRVAQLLVWSSDGRVMLPGQDFDVAWDESYRSGKEFYLSQCDWETKLKPGGRGGFGSTGRH